MNPGSQDWCVSTLFESALVYEHKGDFSTQGHGAISSLHSLIARLFLLLVIGDIKVISVMVLGLICNPPDKILLDLLNLYSTTPNLNGKSI